VWHQIEEIKTMSQQDTRANTAITTAVLSTAAAESMTIAAVLAESCAMINTLAHIYGYQGSTAPVMDCVSKLIIGKHATLFALQKMWTITGARLSAVIAGNAAMNGLITLAVGKAAQLYFKTGERKELERVVDKVVTLRGLDELKQIVAQGC
jgi:hypothetical protein